jgi:Flp pilus assembly pilin Flp
MIKSKRALQRLQRHSRRGPRGQGMVEYALVLVLVAVVAIVALSALGNATQRVYGVIGGVLGAKYNTTGDRAIEIATAQCIAVSYPNPSNNRTGLWVVGNTNISVAELTGSTDQAVGTGIGGGAAPVEANGPNGFKFNPLLAYGADPSVCPKAVVIQAPDGSVAISPVTTVSMTVGQP